MYLSAAVAVAVVLGTSGVNGHMRLSTPHPYGQNSLTNDPLEHGGGNFPCKLRDGVWDPPEQPNIFPAGSTQLLSLLGSATHGGGSCQISLTTDMQPKKDSKWMVIWSMEGGCPANNPGNLGTNPNAEDPYQFHYTIPEDIPNGNYTLGWTWHTRVGVKDLFMNCAPITVTGGKDGGPPPTDKYPPMFVANINGCEIPEGPNLRYRNPGPNVFTGNSYLQKQGDPPCIGGPTFATDGYKAASNPPTATPVPDNPAPVSSIGISGATSAVGGAAPTQSASGGSGKLQQGHCSPEGSYFCFGESYQRCASGAWGSEQKLAPGMNCPEGQHQNLDLTRRNFETMRDHFRRHVAHVATYHE